MIFRIKHAPIVYFEIPADDVQRAKKFYNDVFGWKMEKWPAADGKDNSLLLPLILSIG
jgi:predicted enzyme related to lactoylglutathione lyase